MYVVDSLNPGSDLLGTASAALAASAMVVQQYDAGYASLLLEESVQLYNFGKAYPGEPLNGAPVMRPVAAHCLPRWHQPGLAEATQSQPWQTAVAAAGGAI